MALRSAQQLSGRALLAFSMVGSVFGGACGGNAFSVASSGASASGNQSGSTTSGVGSGGHSGASAGTSDGGSTGASGGSSTGGSTGSGSGSSGAGETGSSSGASGSSGSAADAGPAIACPVIAPNAGSICPKVGLECEYGSSPDIRCNQVAVCQAPGWVYDAASKCPAALCPVGYDDIVAGDHCPISGETCAYTKGTCICAADTGGPVRLVDAGVATNWACFEATLQCRSPRPNIGDACTDDARVCDYGVCSGGVEIDCTGGLWQDDPMVCAQAN